ncbi:hypothetical protein BaRGS_00001582 [Batillaria attramentaria]|uniref:Uncharacterized protein n=1 Tax=Batillaria attramentaria TaxID=370345 RepID=A0ABD0M7I6_9CAEN
MVGLRMNFEKIGVEYSMYGGWGGMRMVGERTGCGGRGGGSGTVQGVDGLSVAGAGSACSRRHERLHGRDRRTSFRAEKAYGDIKVNIMFSEFSDD